MPANSALCSIRLRSLGLLAVAGVAAGALAASTVALAQARSVPSFTAAQAARGKDLYAANCALCHGDALEDGQFGPPLKGAPHKTYWQGKTAADLMTYMSSMMPPTQPGGLGAQAYADVFAFMLQAGGAAPSDKELPSDPNALKGAAPTT